MAESKVPLSRYRVTIRSFHPKKSFGYSGFWFGGDNRGFSTKPNADKSITSRIYHSIEIDLAKRDIISKQVYSDASHPPWSDSKYRYKNKPVGPKLKIEDKRFYARQTESLHWAHIEGRYFGSNHAMPLSEQMQK